MVSDRRAIWILLILFGAMCIGSIIAWVYLMRDDELNSSITIADAYGEGTHHLAGSVRVRSTCDQLSATAERMSPSTIEIILTTWEEPSIPCTVTPTPRQFTVTAFGALDTRFTASLDNSPITVILRPDIAWNSASSATLTTARAQ